MEARQMRDARWMSLIGLCPALLVSETLAEGVVLGVTVLLVLTGTDVIVGALSRVIPGKFRPVAAAVPMTALLALLELAWLFIPQGRFHAPEFVLSLLTMCCMLLGRSTQAVGMGKMVMDALVSGVQFALILCLTTGVRELLGAGTLLGFPVLGEAFRGAAMLATLPGGMLTLGFVMAACSVAETLGGGLRGRRRKDDQKNEREEANSCQ